MIIYGKKVKKENYFFKICYLLFVFLKFLCVVGIFVEFCIWNRIVELRVRWWKWLFLIRFVFYIFYIDLLVSVGGFFVVLWGEESI